MKLLSLRKLFVLFIVLAATTGVSAQQKTPNLTLKDLNGHTVRLADLRGRVVLLNFWATWCVPCQAEIPDLIKHQQRYRARGLRIVGITYPPERMSEVRGFTRRLRINYPVVIGAKETRQTFTSSETLPLTVIIDRAGNIRGIIEGVMYPDEFDEKVKPLLLPPTQKGGNI